MHTNEDIYTAGKAQANIMYVILLHVVILIFAPEGTATLLSGCVGLFALYFVYKMAVGLKLQAPWFYALLQFIPGISLLVLFILVSRATKLLQSKGIKVGLMGASSTDLESLLR